jgi:hypothetical protein
LLYKTCLLFNTNLTGNAHPEPMGSSPLFTFSVVYAVLGV